MTDPELQAALAAFGREVLKLVAEGRSVFAEPSDDEIMDLAVKQGLAVLEHFNPDKHGDVEDAEEGGLVYAWTFEL